VASQPPITPGSPRLLAGNACGDIAERHLETTNVLYVDGHVKFLKLDALIGKKSASSGAYSYFTIDAD